MPLSMGLASGRATLTVPRIHRVAAYIALAWAVVLLAWAAYSCFWQVGAADFAKGIVYFGLGDGTGRADTADLNLAVVYLAASLLILRANSWARGLACGAALIEGYNRLRSLTGALFDSHQSDWFLHTTEGQLKLATFAAGVLVTATLVILLIKEATVYEPWVPPTNAWAQQPAPFTPQPAPPMPPQGQYGYPQQHQQAPLVPPAPQAQAMPPQVPNPYQYPQQPGTPYQGHQPPQPPQQPGS
ncbi:hypothetical protein ACGFYU_22175 [Streptomyces sp. NPDC048337]|uniref:hypothetical protein n=1 Tax=Streptomyces sp. NPDC048337 TaxID=3365535 RepID=UPI00371807D8